MIEGTAESGRRVRLMREGLILRVAVLLRGLLLRHGLQTVVDGVVAVEVDVVAGENDSDVADAGPCNRILYADL